jgi:hypothetical protein
MARVHAHPRSMDPKMDSLLYAILGCLRRSYFVSPLWIRQTDTQGRRSALVNYACFPASSPSFSLFQRPPSPSSWRNEKSRLRSWKLEPNPTAIGEGAHREKDGARDDGKHNDKTKTNQNVVLDRYVL